MTDTVSLMGSFSPDSGVYLAKLNTQVSLTNDKAQFCYVLPAPTGADLGGSFVLIVPQNYSSTPVVRVIGVIDGTPANVFGIGCQFIQIAAAATIDVAYEAEDTASNSTWTGYADEEVYTLSITLTPSSAFTPGSLVLGRFYRDDSVDTQTIDFLMVDLIFEYTQT